MSVTVVLLVLAAVFVGAATQRITGMGFALVAGPFLVLLLDPVPGVVLVNLCSVVSAALVLTRVWRQVRWKRVAVLLAGSLVGILPGAWLAVSMGSDALYVLVGGLIVLGIASSLLGSRFAAPVVPRPWKSGTAGVVSGFMSGAAGVGGPALSVYAIMTRWEQRSFAATAQGYFLANAACAVIAKVALDPARALPHLTWQVWVAILVAMLVGLAAGDGLSRRVPLGAARAGMIALAFAGGAFTLVKGVTGLL
ncbi:sulfite exporter TauE/SafE family protein [Brevibacterium litoralis]|uniref:sulfite exporter TauE/SafE family protein n=1 Tax=Brevibacterium litoralis TaxID=3138935 RepID=UPI0032EE72DF